MIDLEQLIREAVARELDPSCHAGADHGPARLYRHGWLCDACWCWLYLRGWIERRASQ